MAPPSPAPASPADIPGFLAGGGIAARLILERDWSAHPLGPPAGWPPALCSALSLVLNSPESMILAWGPDLSFFFNDTYIPLLGPRVDWAMGARFDAVWADAWDQARPIVDEALAGRPARFVDMPWTLDTDRGARETWWTFSYSRILDADGAVSGLFILTNETTDRILHERASRAADNRNRQILDSARDHAIVAMDRRGLVTGWNAGAARVLGWSEVEMLGQPMDRVFTPEDRAAGRPAIERQLALETGGSDDRRWYRRASGERFWASGELTPLHDETGAISGYVKILRDDTERQQAEDLRRQTSERLASALEIAQLGTIDWDMRARTVAMDARARHIFGFGDRAVVPQDEVFARIVDADLDRIRAAATDAMLAGRTLDAEFAVAVPGVGTRHVATHGFVVRDPDGGIAHLFATWHDVTDRRQQQDALVRANRQLETDMTARTAERDRLWEASPDLIAILGPEGRYLRVNPAWTTMLGYAPEEVVGRHLDDFVHPDDRGLTAEALRVAVAGVLPRVENRYLHRDGSLRSLSWVAAPIDGRVYAIGRDVTAERAARAALDMAEEQLRQAQKMEAVGQLTGGVAHDFNNLLTVIRGSVDLLRRPGQSEARRTRYIDAIADTAERATRLTSQLLAFARRQALRPEVFDIADSIDGVLAMVTTLTGSRIAIRVARPDTPCRVDADRNQFDTAIVNMAVNARDAMRGEGRLTIAIGTASGLPAAIVAGGATPAAAGRYVTVALTDTGTGIPAAARDQIFEPFFSTKGPGHGTGLGLSQVYGFATQSGGGVMVDSVEGEGATFTLYLPLVDAAPAPAADAAPPAIGAPAGGGCILVVEDNLDVGRFATQALAELGYETRFAADAAAALALLADPPCRFDAVFSDVVMPGMSGIDLGHAIGRLYPRLPVILASGYSDVLAEQGAQGFDLLQKPYSIDGLSQILRTVMARAA